MREHNLTLTIERALCSYDEVRAAFYLSLYSWSDSRIEARNRNDAFLHLLPNNTVFLFLRHLSLLCIVLIINVAKVSHIHPSFVFLISPVLTTGK